MIGILTVAGGVILANLIMKVSAALVAFAMLMLAESSK